MIDSVSLPVTTVQGLARIPSDRPVAFLLRHSIRPDIPEGETGADLPLTAEGRVLARELGCVLGIRLTGLSTSPVRRCVETAEELRRGAGSTGGVVQDRLLGDPGVFVVDDVLAWQTFCRFPFRELLERLIADHDNLPGFAPYRAAAHRLVAHLITTSETTGGLHVFVSHDFLITLTVSLFGGSLLPKSQWPGFLEGAFIWREDTRLVILYPSGEDDLC